MAEICIKTDNGLYEGEDAIREYAESALRDSFDDMLDDCYGDVEICGYKYSPSIAFKRVDEIAYNCACSDWADSVLSDFMAELESAEDGDVLSVGNASVTVRKDEDEDEEEEED